MIEFECGDRVKYVSHKYPDSESNPLWGGVHGKIMGTVVAKANPNGWTRVRWCNGETNTYNRNELELITATRRKFVLLKPITLVDMVKSGAAPSCVDFRIFTDKVLQGGYAFDAEIRLEDALRWSRTGFLISTGFIGELEIDPSVCMYKIGDVFSANAHRYILAQVDYLQVALINLNTGNRQNDPVKVCNQTQITEAEFSEIAGTLYDDIKKEDKKCLGQVR